MRKKRRASEEPGGEVAGVEEGEEGEESQGGGPVLTTPSAPFTCTWGIRNIE